MPANSLLPITGPSAGWAAALACAGLVLWITGAAFSRSLITLLLVALGTWIGLRLPGWYGWHIDGMALAIGGAIVLGASGYLLHRWWLGLALGCVCALVAMGIAVRMWLAMHHLPMPIAQIASAQQLDAPREHVSVLATLWAAQGAAVGGTAPTAHAHGWIDLFEFLIHQPSVQFLLAAAAIGFFIGLMVAVRWWRLTSALVWSWIGLTLALFMGILAMMQTRLQWLERLPASGRTQLIGYVTLFIVGAAVQYYLAFGRVPAPSAPAPKGRAD